MDIWSSLVLSISRSGDQESDWDFDWETVTERVLVWLLSSWFSLLGTLSVGGFLRRSGFQYGDWEIDRSGFSWISTCWYIAWQIDRNIMLVKGLVLVASPSGYNLGVVVIQIKTTV